MKDNQSVPNASDFIVYNANTPIVHKNSKNMLRKIHSRRCSYKPVDSCSINFTDIKNKVAWKRQGRLILGFFDVQT